MTKVLKCLEGTDFTVDVVLDGDRDYVVRVYRPATDREVELFHPALGQSAPDAREEIAARYLSNTTTEHQLNRVVEDIINAQKPSLVGTYAASTEETE